MLVYLLFSIVAASHKMITRNRQVHQYLMRQRENRVGTSISLFVHARAS
jgi:hypothetical protein